jgi:hypothetical protein
MANRPHDCKQTPPCGSVSASSDWSAVAAAAPQRTIDMGKLAPTADAQLAAALELRMPTRKRHNASLWLAVPTVRRVYLEPEHLC